MISLAHPTVQEFFDRKDEEFFPYAEDVISRACLTYLSFDVFSTSVCTSEEEVLLRKNEHPFFDYASRYWGQHLKGDTEQRLQEDITAFLNQDVALCSAIQVASTLPFHLFETKYEPTTGIHTGDAKDIGNMPSASTRRNVRFHAPDDAPSTIPLTSSSWNKKRQKKAKYWLVTKTTPLHAVAGFGLSFTLQRLLSSQGDINSKDSHGRTALYLAAETGQETVLTLLLDKEADLEEGDRDGWKPLYIAANNGHQRIVEILLGKGAQVSLEGLGDTTKKSTRRLLAVVWRVIMDYKDSEHLPLAYFEPYDVRHATETFPSGSGPLLARLGHANVARRRRIKYFEIHRERLLIADRRIDQTSEPTKESELAEQKELGTLRSESIAHTFAKAPSLTRKRSYDLIYYPIDTEGLLPLLPVPRFWDRVDCPYCYRTIQVLTRAQWR
jgi:hypothetical protein